MSLLEIKWHPTGKELRSFGKIALIASVVIPLLLHVIKGLGSRWALIIFAVGLAIFIISLFSVKLTRIIYIGLTAATMPIGLVVSFVLLATFYFLLITPLGLFFRLIGRDPLRREFDLAAKSYWHLRRSPDSLESYFRQF